MLRILFQFISLMFRSDSFKCSRIYLPRLAHAFQPHSTVQPNALPRTFPFNEPLTILKSLTNHSCIYEGTKSRLSSESTHHHSAQNPLSSSLLTPLSRFLLEKLSVIQLVKLLEGSLPCSQQPTTGPHPEPVASSPQHSTLFP
jgi:hypothetical protein